MPTPSDVAICNLALTQLGANTIASLAEGTETARKCNAIYTLIRDAALRAHPWNFAIKRVDLDTTGAHTGTGLDDLTGAGTFTGSAPLKYRIQIDAEGTPDTFKWSTDGGATWTAETVAITGAAQTLSNGITVTFAATTGHTLGDYWDVSAPTTPAFGYSNAFLLPTDYLKTVEVDENETEFKIEGGLLLTDEDSIEVRYIAQITDPTEFDSLFVDAFAALLASNLAYAITSSRSVEAQKLEIFKTKLREARSIDGQEGTPEDMVDDEWILARSE